MQPGKSHGDAKQGAAATRDAQGVLAQWLQDEARVRAAARGEPGVASREQLFGRSGLAFFEAMLSGELPLPLIGSTLDFVPIRFEPGVAIFQGTPGREHYNPLGSVHGGWFCTLLD